MNNGHDEFGVDTNGQLVVEDGRRATIKNNSDKVVVLHLIKISVGN